MAEVVVAVALVAVLGAMAVPATVTATDAARVRQAAAFLAGHFRLARQAAIFRTASTGLVFDEAGQTWTFRVCVDGNHNGLRRADITRSTDACAEGPIDLGRLFPGVTIASDPTIRGPDNEPGSTDAVRFGTPKIASFSPAGTCTAGSIFLRSTAGEQFVVRVAGVNGRTRILRYDRASRTWLDD
jgi:type II secretory pathway pseudopilin PulG